MCVCVCVYANKKPLFCHSIIWDVQQQVKMKCSTLQVNTYIILNQDACMFPLFLLHDFCSCAYPQKQAYPLGQDYDVLCTYSVVHRCWAETIRTWHLMENLKCIVLEKALKLLQRKLRLWKQSLKRRDRSWMMLLVRKIIKLYVLDPGFTLQWNQNRFKYNRGKGFQSCG